MSSVSDSASLSSLDSGSDRSGEDGSSQSMSGDRGQLGGEWRIPMEMTTKIREDPPKELAESNWPVKAGYGWVAEDVRTQYSFFRWSRLLKSWLNCIPIFERGARKDIVALERVSVVGCVCYGQEGATEKFFYMYMCHFLQLYPSPHSFLYIFDTWPKSPTTKLSIISRLGINRLDAFTQSFKHFKDGFFKVVVKESGHSYFYTDDGNTKFPFSWTDNPWRYKDMKREKLSVVDMEVVDTLMKFNDKMPTKGLARVYNSVHPIVDIKGHIAQVGKKNLNLLQALRKEKAGALNFPTCKNLSRKCMCTRVLRGKRSCLLGLAGHGAECIGEGYGGV
ncbi:hypothetical protein DEO72_LG11g830 [Vigna unguiculata]|uniref:Transposase n=1 Tax=Vigna unguiculata TaxID=3917 RepID=A0A4D6NLB2_VIGUN|nr:hypothetical protein DEO72_LG11g830 [Vigna unguiculata]